MWHNRVHGSYTVLTVISASSFNNIETQEMFFSLSVYYETEMEGPLTARTPSIFLKCYF